MLSLTFTIPKQKNWIPKKTVYKVSRAVWVWFCDIPFYELMNTWCQIFKLRISTNTNICPPEDSHMAERLKLVEEIMCFISSVPSCIYLSIYLSICLYIIYIFLSLYLYIYKYICNTYIYIYIHIHIDR